MTRAPFGTTPTGDTVEAFTLANGRGLEVRATNFGGVIVSLLVPDRDGRPANVVLGHDSLDAYLSDSRYFGAIIGRCANRIAHARFTLAAIPKMMFPALVILPGMIATALHSTGGGLLPIGSDGTPNYNLAVPVMLAHYLPSGLLGLGLTALMASFMSGMAGNVTAFNTVWTYDIYQSYVRPGQSDGHYLRVGHAATVFGILLSVAAAYATTRFNNIMDMLQLVFAFVNAPLFATFLLGMFWRRTTGHGAFFGLLIGTLAAAIHHGVVLPQGAVPGLKGGFLGMALHTYPSEMAQNFWTAIFAWSTCFVATIVISFLTRRNKTDDDLKGLVYSLTPRLTDHDLPWYKRPATLGVIVLGFTAILNVIFW